MEVMKTINGSLYSLQEKLMVFTYSPINSLLMAIIKILYHENGMKYSWI